VKQGYNTCIPRFCGISSNAPHLSKSSSRCTAREHCDWQVGESTMAQQRAMRPEGRRACGREWLQLQAARVTRERVCPWLSKRRCSFGQPGHDACAGRPWEGERGGGTVQAKGDCTQAHTHTHGQGAQQVRGLSGRSAAAEDGRVTKKRPLFCLFGLAFVSTDLQYLAQ
jgi:hypothetical protein